jgi:hypothetical protein
MKQPVFGILCRTGTVWAEAVEDVGADFNLSSQKKLQPVLLSIQIPGKHTTVSPREDASTFSLITAKNSTAMEKKIISMVWRDSGDT